MNNERLDTIDSIYIDFERLKQAIEDGDSRIVENRIDGFGNMTMGRCQNYFGEDSELYKEAQKIYGEVLMKKYEKTQGTLILIKSFLEKIHLERQKEIS